MKVESGSLFVAFPEVEPVPLCLEEEEADVSLLIQEASSALTGHWGAFGAEEASWMRSKTSSEEKTKSSCLLKKSSFRTTMTWMSENLYRLQTREGSPPNPAGPLRWGGVSRIFHVVQRQKMKGKGRSAVEKQQESCDVWLDLSALKRRKVMNATTKSALTLLGQHSCPAAIIGLHPCTKQTTISTFFTAQKAGEKTTDPNKQLMTSASNNTVHLKGSGLLRGKRTRGPASVLQPSRLQDCQRQPAKATKASGPFLCSSLPAQAQSHPSCFPTAWEEETVREGEAFLTTDLIQHLGEKGLQKKQGASGSPLKEKNDGWQRGERPAFSQRSPSSKITPNQRRGAGKRRRLASSWAGATFVDDSENRDPELDGKLPDAAYLRDFNQHGFCQKYTDATSCEDSSPASAQRLFTQDSEGYRVILHRFGGEEGSQPPSAKELRWGKGTPGRSSFNNKSCFRDGWAGDGSPPGSLGGSVSPPTERSEKSCYDLLFTEDSEGNKVIKH